MSSRPLVIVLHGPSGVGKDRVIDALRDRTGIHRATSTTNRAPRPDERNGIDYHFVTKHQFEAKIARGDFLEFAQVYGDWKGLEKNEVLPLLAEGRDVIIRTDVQGARRWREILDGAVYVFLIAEDRETLRARLDGRGTEDGGSMARRLAALEEELADIDNNDYVVVNHHARLADAVREIQEIIEQERADAGRPAPHLRA